MKFIEFRKIVQDYSREFDVKPIKKTFMYKVYRDYKDHLGSFPFTIPDNDIALAQFLDNIDLKDYMKQNFSLECCGAKINSATRPASTISVDEVDRAIDWLQKRE